MSKYEDIHLDDGVRHSGLVPTKEERYVERLEAENDALRAEVERLKTESASIQAATSRG